MKRTAKALSVGFLFDDTLDSTAGVAQYVKTMGRWLTQQGHTVTYLVGETNSSEWAGGQIYSLSKNLKVRFNGNHLSTPRPTRNGRQIKKLLAEISPDVIYVQVPYSPFMAEKVLRLASDHTAIVASYNILPATHFATVGAYALRWLLWPSLNRIDKWLATSAAAAKFAERTLGRKTAVSPNVFNFDEFYNPASALNPSMRIVFLGRLVPRKGAMQLLKAYRLLVDKMPEAQLVIAGDGPQRSQLQAFAKQCQLKVEFPGFIAEKDKATLLASATLACFPSVGGESFGISLIEAMAACPGVVLGGDNPGYRTVLGGQPELLVNPNSTEHFAKRLYDLLSNHAKAKRLHDWQLSEAKHYDVNKVGPELIDIFQRAIASRVQKGHN